MPANAKKEAYFQRLEEYMNEFSKILIVHADNVGSQQLHTIRIALRGKCKLLFGKNTMIRKAFKGLMDSKPEIAALMPFIKGNMGFVFTNGDLSEVRDIINQHQKPSIARAGVIAPVDVFVPAGDTGLEPTQTQFLQALNIASKINKGQIQILSDVHLIKKGTKVGSSEAILLGKLSQKPFMYGLQFLQVYEEGCCYSPAALDIDDAQLASAFRAGVANIAAISLASGFPTAASYPHSIINGFKNLLCISLETEYDFKEAKKIKDILSDPEALAAMQAAAASSGAAAGGGGAAAAEPEPEPEEEEEDEDMGFDLFD